MRRLTYYTEQRLRLLNVKSLQGLEAHDIVIETIRKVLEGKRTWKPEVPVTAFLIQTLESETSNLIRDGKKIRPLLEKDNNTGVGASVDLVSAKIHAIEQLRAAGADDIEIYVFDCWIEGVYKPAEIAIELELDIKDVYNALKRLGNKLIKLQDNEN
ncbi:MAG: hypothetical protein JNJ75_17455 [Cyclobacteriaceae bacterium]|nr:hypothetical protein [Cyclobacteriaceae bacterium]